MSSYMRFTTLIILSFLYLQSCSNRIGEVDLLNLETEFELNLIQRLDSNGSHPSILVKTINEYDCGNADIDVFDEENSFTINGLQLETSCDNVSSIIEKQIDIRQLGSTTELMINLKSIAQNQGFIEDDGKTYELAFDSYHGIKVVGSRINKINSPLIWGTYSISSLDFISELTRVVSENYSEIEISAGDYGLFTINDNETITIRDSFKEVVGGSLYLPVDIDLQSLDSIITTLKSSVALSTNDISFSFQNQNGEYLRQ